MQRFGRCNRHGELNAYGTDIFWIDLEENLAAPYPNQSLGTARQILENLNSASPADLTEPPGNRGPAAARSPGAVRPDPDRPGPDPDIALYIRDGDDPDVQVFWHHFAAEGAADQPHPSPAELCRASLGQLKGYLSKRREGSAGSGKFLNCRVE